VVSVQPSGLAAATYSGSIQISSAERPTPGDGFRDADRGSAASVFGGVSSDTHVQLRNRRFLAGCAERLYHEQRRWIAVLDCLASANWIGVSPPSGKAPATLSISVNPASLSAGSYVGNVQITSTGATGSPAAVAVTLLVQLRPQRPPLPLLSTLPVSRRASPRVRGLPFSEPI